MSWQQYQVKITPSAQKQLQELAKKLGKKLFRQLREAIEDLAHDPEGKTQELGADLSEYRSLHVSRCRVIVRIVDVTVTVCVVAAGWHARGDRNDVYQRFLRDVGTMGRAIDSDEGEQDE